VCRIRHRLAAAILVLPCVLRAEFVRPARAQQDARQQRSGILEFPNLGPVPGSTELALGPGPGALEPAMTLGGSAGILGGSRRVGRTPRTTRATPATTVVANRGLREPEALPGPQPPPAAVPLPAPAFDERIFDDPGPPDGLTLDAAIDRMMKANLDMRALRHELTQADADVLTAGLRTNPLVYMDTQFIPYGSFTPERPGGPTQYDLNVTYPLDVSGKRKARVVVARMARSGIESQFQDVARRQIDNVYKAFTTLQAAWIDLLMARAAVRRHEQVLADVRAAGRAAGRTDARAAADTIDHLTLVLERTRSGLGEAEEAYADAQDGLAVLLNLPAADVASLAPHGSLRDSFPTPPTADELTTLALRCRPDVHAARLGIDRAGAEARLQRANLFEDVYLFYDPITYQDNRPQNLLSAHSWAVGLTFALPIFNRNQGNIARAQSNLSQSKLELSALERRVVAEVRLADREYRRSCTALDQIEQAILPRARNMLHRKTKQLAAGTIDSDAYQVHLDETAEIVQSHRDALLRRRRAMLDLNTAVGLRLLP
jgi:cobalt-zinc-cadmium efflux system outer membrane protein